MVNAFLLRPLPFHEPDRPVHQLTFDPATRRYTVDPDGSGDAAQFSFTDPDVNVKSLRLNAVFRWEPRPGSTFYAVWTRQQQDFGNPGVFAPGRDLAGDEKSEVRSQK